MDSATWDERYSTSELIWTGQANQFVERHLADLTPGTAIDLGAGEGRNAVWLAQRGWSVTAVDFSQVGLDKALRLADEHDVTIAVERADATTWTPTAPVDLVVLSYLQLPTDERRTVLEHTATWLTPGGTRFMIAHDRSNVTAGYGGPPSAEVCYTVEETVTALDGLEIVTAEVAERHVDTPEGTKTALDTLVIARRPI
ncbi:MAG: class I SAM-dependent methyltransferase [Acidimicrobiales bacterium]|nr:MAG: class I SAM-dependent methyltransferase [Acidimicrobiales bacterium]